jgi:hypothetical protein
MHAPECRSTLLVYDLALREYYREDVPYLDKVFWGMLDYLLRERSRVHRLSVFYLAIRTGKKQVLQHDGPSTKKSHMTANWNPLLDRLKEILLYGARTRSH